MRYSLEKLFGHEMALEEVSEADFWCNLHNFSSLIDL